MGMALIALSIAIYSAQVFIFHDARNTIFYLLQDMAFVPLQVFVVTVLLDRILSSREKQQKLRKINIVISAFFNEIGISLIEEFAQFCTNIDQLKQELEQETDWEKNTVRISKMVDKFKYNVDSKAGNLPVLKTYLMENKRFVLGMFENPNLLEHDAFTDMLWAVYHVADELENRDNPGTLPENDLKHLSGDIERAFKLLLIEWTYYMNHLKKEYPYLFSLAVRKNPFTHNTIIFN